LISSARPGSHSGRMAGFLDLRIQRFRDSLNAARSYFAIQGVSDLCLEIKRIRELFTLVGHAAPPFAQDPDDSIFSRLLPKANALHEIDISQSIAMKWLPTLDLSEYFNCLKDRELRVRDLFLEAASDFPAAALAQTRLLVFSVTAIEDNRLSFQKKVRRRLIRSADELVALAGGRELNSDLLRGVFEAAESFRFQTEAGAACLDKEILTDEISGPIEEVCSSLGEWNDLTMTIQSVDAFHLEATGSTLSDTAAYVNFRQVLLQQAKDFVEACKRGRKPLVKALGKFSKSL
jgi:hypothetical protein